jgi:hypothetical protein
VKRDYQELLTNSIALRAPFSPQEQDSSSQPLTTYINDAALMDKTNDESLDIDVVPATRPCFGINVQTLRRRARKDIYHWNNTFGHLLL